jgi:hypothetical protein
MQKYGGSSIQDHILLLSVDFRASGVIVSHRMIDAGLYFDMFHLLPFGTGKICSKE